MSEDSIHSNESQIVTVNAAIVAYNRPNSIQELVESLLWQTYPVHQIIIIDNSRTDAVELALKSYGDRLFYQRMKENVGSAGGFSRAIEIASKESDFVWVFDDDMNVKNDALFELMRHLSQLSQDGKLGVMRCWYEDSPETSPKEISDFSWRGTLISTRVIHEIGLPDPSYFLYGEDVDYALRIRKAGYRLYYIPSSVMWVNSSPTKLRMHFFGKPMEIHHSPFRLYYAVRNEIRLYKKHLLLLKLLRAIAYTLKILVTVSFLRDQKKNECLKAILLGFMHGIIGKDDRCDLYTDEQL